MLVRTLADIQQVVPVTNEFPTANFTPYVRAIEGRFLAPILGQELLRNLNNRLSEANEEDPLSESEAELIDLCRVLTVNIGMVSYLKINQAQIGKGASREAENQNQKAARLQVLEDQRAELLSLGYEAIENLIEYLEINGDQFPELNSNQYWRDVAKLFVSNARQFSKWCSIGDNRWTYMQLINALQVVEKTSIRAALGNEFMEEFRAKVKAGEVLTEAEIDLKDAIETSCCNLAMAKAMSRLAVEIGPMGVTVAKTYTDQSIVAKDPADLSRLKLLKEEFEAEGNRGLTDIRDVLYKNANAEEFSTFKASSVYKPDVPSDFTNNPETGILYTR